MSQMGSMQEKKSAYDAILKLYDCAEDIINAIEAVGGEEVEPALAAAEPVIEQLETTAGILSETFIAFGETGEKMNAHSKKRAEASIRKLYAALSTFCETVGEALLGVKADLIEIAGDIRSQIMQLQQKAKRKFGDRAERLFNIMLWIGDYMKKLAVQLEKVGTGLESALAIPSGLQLQAVTGGGHGTFLRAAENTRAQSERSWSL